MSAFYLRVNEESRKLDESPVVLWKNMQFKLSKNALSRFKLLKLGKVHGHQKAFGEAILCLSL